MKKLVSIIILLIAINACLICQVSIDFCPKALKSELKKISGSDELEMKEITTAGNHANRWGKFFILPEPCTTLGLKYLYVGRVNTCRTGGCSINTNNDLNQEKEFFDYYILFSTTGIVQKVKIFNYQSTHGQEVTATSWLKQFGNYDGRSELVVGKNIDAIAGATISVDATSFDIEDKTKLLLKILNRIGG